MAEAGLKQKYPQRQRLEINRCRLSPVLTPGMRLDVWYIDVSSQLIT